MFKGLLFNFFEVSSIYLNDRECSCRGKGRVEIACCLRVIYKLCQGPGVIIIFTVPVKCPLSLFPNCPWLRITCQPPEPLTPAPVMPQQGQPANPTLGSAHPRGGAQCLELGLPLYPQAALLNAGMWNRSCSMPCH